MNHQSQQEKQLPANQLSNEDPDVSHQTSAQQFEAHQYNPGHHGHEGLIPSSQERGQMIEEEHSLFNHFIPQAFDQTNDSSEYPIEPLESQLPQAPIPQSSTSTVYGHHPQTNGQYAYGQQPARPLSSLSPGVNSSYGHTVMENPFGTDPGHSPTQQPEFTGHIDLLNLGNSATPTGPIDLLNLGNSASRSPVPWLNNPLGYEAATYQPSALSGYSSFPNNSTMNLPVNPQQQPASRATFHQPWVDHLASSATSNTQVDNPNEQASYSDIRHPTRPDAPRWTPEEVRRAQQMRASGFTTKQIAEALNRTERSVAVKLWRVEGNDAHKSVKKDWNGGRAVK